MRQSSPTTDWNTTVSLKSLGQRQECTRRTHKEVFKEFFVYSTSFMVQFQPQAAQLTESRAKCTQLFGNSQDRCLASPLGHTEPPGDSQVQVSCLTPCCSWWWPWAEELWAAQELGIAPEQRKDFLTERHSISWLLRFSISSFLSL